MSALEKVLYLAAHGGFEGANAPLGGGAAISNLLTNEWRDGAPFALEPVTPAILGASAPHARDIVRYGEREYGAFCMRFREAATRRVLEEDPARAAVLVNDISEGPDFRRLAGAGYRLFTIYHVDVVAYIARIYLRGFVEPRLLTRLWRAAAAAGVTRAAPRILRLIFDQQNASVECSRKLVVPSHGMKRTLLRCYPRLTADRVEVVPWGAPPAEAAEAAAREEAQRLRAEYGVPEDAAVALTLSRISPEKGQDLLLRALLEWERRGGPGRPVWVFICGEAAFMQGAKHLALLHELAARLRSVKAVFPGHVTGLRKAGFFALADVYAFPSRHESYGLTLMEAMRAGLASIALDHDGSRESLPDHCGIVVPQRSTADAVEGLREALERLLGDARMREAFGSAAAEYASARPFSKAAAALAGLIAEVR